MKKGMTVVPEHAVLAACLLLAVFAGNAGGGI